MQPLDIANITSSPLPMVDVWKCKFHCYSEIVRYTDQEMTAIENYLPTTVPSGRGHITPCRATGEAPGLVRRQTVWGEHGKSLYQGSVRSYGQGSLSIGCSDEFHQVLQSRDCPGLSGTQLFLGGRVEIRVGECWPGVKESCVSPIREMFVV